MPAPQRAQPTRRPTGAARADGATRRKPARAEPAAARPGAQAVRMFANAAPGLAPLLAREINAIDGLTARGSGFDGRSDVVLFDAEPSMVPAVLDLRLAEDVFVEVGRTLRSEGDRAGWIAGRIWKPERAQRALTVKGRVGRTPGKRSTFRVIARVLQERSFLRTDLRRELTQAIARTQPEWRFADPSEVEIWVSEFEQGKILAGVRLSDAAMRQHEGREGERSGALRPTVAAAMVALAGEPAGLLLDPCCGSGTILAEAIAVGWETRGIDIDPEAVRIATANARAATIAEGDARKLDLADAAVDAYVSNYPFGQQYAVQGTMESWLTTVLKEAARVTRLGWRRTAAASRSRMRDLGRSPQPSRIFLPPSRVQLVWWRGCAVAGPPTDPKTIVNYRGMTPSLMDNSTVESA